MSDDGAARSLRPPLLTVAPFVGRGALFVKA
jgi:hypothetical protein